MSIHSLCKRCPWITFLNPFTVLHVKKHKTMRNWGMMRTGDNAITHWGRGWGSRWGEGLNWGAGARANLIPWYQEIWWRSGDTATAQPVSFIITSNETTSAESPAFCHAPECASSLGKIKRNYHLKELTHKRVKARAWAWFSLAVYLVQSLQPAGSDVKCCFVSFSINLAEAEIATTHELVENQALAFHGKITTAEIKGRKILVSAFPYRALDW